MKSNIKEKTMSDLNFRTRSIKRPIPNHTYVKQQFCVGSNNIQEDLVIHWPFIWESAYSHWQKVVKMTIFQLKKDFLSANSRFAVQNDGNNEGNLYSEFF